MSWLNIPQDSDFPLENIPFGVVSTQDCPTLRCATRVGEYAIDLAVIEEAGLLDDIPALKANTFTQRDLNKFLQHEKHVWSAVRHRIQSVLPTLDEPLQKACAHPIQRTNVHLPIHVGDYTDFYSSREHATNVGIMFRGSDNALTPNWLHLPVGYHGRASTVRVSGHSFHRPCGQIQKVEQDPTQGSRYGPCQLLDFELELAAVVGGPDNEQGPMTIQQAKDRIFGFLVMNDWSARDIQKWEYVPLGPFTSKNFCTTVSPWIVATEALEMVPTSAGIQDPEPLEYLRDPEYGSFNIALTVQIQSKAQHVPHTVCQSNFANLYWNVAQQLCHHSVTGCVMKAGDLLGSGTISGATPESFGSMLELSWKGTKDVKVGDEIRKFLEDGDTVIMKGISIRSDGPRIGFGECRATILPALENLTVELPPPTSERYTDLKLYSFWQSSSSWRVRIALAAKNISAEIIPVNLTTFENRTAEYLAINPQGQVPLLECTDRHAGRQIRISQSVAIIEFLEEAFPDKRSLFPNDPMERAAAREMVELMNAGTQPLQNMFWLKRIEEMSNRSFVAADEAKYVNERGMKLLESFVLHRAKQGPYCLGTFSPSIVDIFMVPQIDNARRFQVDVESICPALLTIYELCMEHPWFRSTQPSSQPDKPNP